MASDQYAQQPSAKDPLAEARRAKQQYSTDVPKTTLGDYSFKALRHAPAHQAVRHIPFPYPGPGTSSGGLSGGGGGGGGPKPAKKPLEHAKAGIRHLLPEQTPPLHPHQERHESEFKRKWGRREPGGHSPWGRGRDFDDQPIDPLSGASGGVPVWGGPKPGGLSGGAAAMPEPKPQAQPVMSRSL